MLMTLIRINMREVKAYQILLDLFSFSQDFIAYNTKLNKTEKKQLFHCIQPFGICMTFEIFNFRLSLTFVINSFYVKKNYAGIKNIIFKTIKNVIFKTIRTRNISDNRCTFGKKTNSIITFPLKMLSSKIYKIKVLFLYL